MTILAFTSSYIQHHGSFLSNFTCSVESTINNITSTEGQPKRTQPLTICRARADSAWYILRGHMLSGLSTMHTILDAIHRLQVTWLYNNLQLHPLSHVLHTAIHVYIATHKIGLHVFLRVCMYIHCKNVGSLPKMYCITFKCTCLSWCPFV